MRPAGIVGETMKRHLLCVLLLSLLLPASNAWAQQIKLRASLQVAVTDPFFGISLVRFKEEVEKRSGQSVSIEIFDKGQLYKDTQVVDAVSSGAIEMGIAGSTQFSNRIPAVGIVDQPFLFNFDALVRAALSPGSEIRRLIDGAILTHTGVRVLWWQSLGNTIVYSKGRDVAEPERIKDQKIRVFGKVLGALVELCGGKPAPVGVAKIHDDLKRGALDMAMAGVAAIESRSLWKVTDTITRTELAPVEFLLVINEKVWRSLSPRHQTILAEAALDVERETRDRVADIEAKAYAFASTKGVKVLQLTPDQVAEWRACSADVLADYMATNGDLARQLMVAYAKCARTRAARPAERRGIHPALIFKDDAAVA
jgi:C4-dicarboxylate-binding protein DctP